MSDDVNGALIEKAIGALVSAILDDRERRSSAAQSSDALSVTAFARLSSDSDEKMELDAIIKRPVERACKREIKRLGQMLFDLYGSTDAQREAQYRIAEFDAATEGRRLSILDKVWDGIGRDGDRWWA